MKKLNILILFAAIFFASCDDYVDITPKGSAIAEDLDDVNALLESTDSYGLGAFGSVIELLVNDNLTLNEEEVSYWASQSWYRKNAAIYNLDPVFHDESQEDREWSYHYSSITKANYILQVLEEVTGDEARINQYKAEALTHRAIAYWRVVNIFGQHYGLPAAAEEESGVPILFKYADQSESLLRASVNAVYEQIVTDLTTAIPLLMEGRPYIDRINKAAAQGVLARVYLHMGDYANALEQANAALAHNSTLIDYNDYDPFAGNYIPKGLDNPEHVLFRATYPVTTGAYPNTVGAGRFSDALAAVFTDKVNDLRIAKHSSTYPDPNDPSKTIYHYAQNSYSSYRYAMGITVPELLLIKAESAARTGDVAGGLDAANTLRAKRFDATVVAADGHLLATTDQAEAIQMILDERRREFHVKGYRFFEIKRLNALHNAGISLTRGSVTWQANSINWAAPIGAAVVNTSNGQIKQNPRE
ncbi:RagB/SusD family nutrient uptake outer membrane protein [Marinifilum caeruleilacunae]|uniref:RagB/SusD family nutrient uptake outer membrane protein n=1 Tax=Marinifilum caeruleilacunae TaxID=2499076 RepID=A0ABX1WT99_9BACT|nr:RagB/SusD family nutrient uptake outer membrane protein [Marinifilum caeruleilacunae]NOU59325.1 RagB/SusD family nutrient uptake outer membrane protein [Marinifilum caeruleilacunae]